MRIVPLLLLFSLVAARPQQTVTGRVVGVIDGDTLSVLTSEHHEMRVRLAEIDAPESKQAFGKRAKQALADLVYGRTVTVQIIDWDRYARAVGVVSRGDTDVNLEMVRRGMAWAYRKYLERPEILDAERQARLDRRGLWADAQPAAPWEFRHAGQAHSLPTGPAADANASAPSTIDRGPIVGNRKSRIYHWPGCPNYADIAAEDRAYFATRHEADAAGYKPARNCP